MCSHISKSSFTPAKQTMKYKTVSQLQQLNVSVCNAGMSGFRSPLNTTPLSGTTIKARYSPFTNLITRDSHRWMRQFFPHVMQRVSHSSYVRRASSMQYEESAARLPSFQYWMACNPLPLFGSKPFDVRSSLSRMHPPYPIEYRIR